jgi:hypothetical protein
MINNTSKHHTTLNKQSTTWNRQCRTYLLFVAISLSAIGVQLTQTAMDTRRDANLIIEIAVINTPLETFTLNADKPQLLM